MELSESDSDNSDSDYEDSEANSSDDETRTQAQQEKIDKAYKDAGFLYLIQQLQTDNEETQTKAKAYLNAKFQFTNVDDQTAFLQNMQSCAQALRTIRTRDNTWVKAAQDIAAQQRREKRNKRQQKEASRDLGAGGNIQDAFDPAAAAAGTTSTPPPSSDGNTFGPVTTDDSKNDSKENNDYDAGGFDDGGGDGASPKPAATVVPLDDYTPPDPDPNDPIDSPLIEAVCTFIKRRANHRTKTAEQVFSDLLNVAPQNLKSIQSGLVVFLQMLLQIVVYMNVLLNTPRREDSFKSSTFWGNNTSGMVDEIDGAMETFQTFIPYNINSTGRLSGNQIAPDGNTAEYQNDVIDNIYKKLNGFMNGDTSTRFTSDDPQLQMHFRYGGVATPARLIVTTTPQPVTRADSPPSTTPHPDPHTDSTPSTTPQPLRSFTPIEVPHASNEDFLNSLWDEEYNLTYVE
jgi:hypothetical protein